MDCWKAFLVAMLLTPLSSHACDHLRQQNNGGSAHIGGRAEMNEWNPGVGLVCDVGATTSLFAGGYENSFDQNSAYVGVNKHLRFGGAWHFDPGVTLLFATGYPRFVDDSTQHWGLTALGYITLSVAYESSAKLNIGYGPSRLFSAHGIDVLMVNFEIGLGAK